MVDVELFEQVGQRLPGHSRDKKDRVRRRRDAYKRLARLAALVSSSEGEATEDQLVKQLMDAKAAVKRAEAALQMPERFAASRENAWEALSGIIHETRNIAAMWAGWRPSSGWFYSTTGCSTR